MAAKSGGFGQAMKDFAKSIGNALGIGNKGTASGAGAGGLSVLSGPSTGTLGLPFGSAKPAAPSLSRAERDGPNRSAPVAAPAQPAPAPVVLPVAPPAVETPAPPPPPAPVDLAAPTTSETEAAAVDSTKRGRAATIFTGMQGLLANQEATGQLRRRRSLMGGGLIQ